MRLRPEQLNSQLDKQLLPVYLVSGDETLLVQEACDAIRARCREAGCTERDILLADRTFNWDNLLATAAEMSLFAERKVIELRIPNGKPGADGSRALVEYLANPSPDNILLIVAGKIEKQSTNSKWFKTIDQAGAVLQIWPVDARDLPRWMQQRLTRAGLQADGDALQLLCERIEGNLLAAVQEIEKLRLLCKDGRVTLDSVSEAVADNARYSLFGMTDSALAGDTANALKMLQGLRAEGSEATLVLWALSREIRVLYQCRSDMDRGQPQQRVLQAQRIWDSRKPVMAAALSRHTLGDLAQLLHQANIADQSIKGLADGNPWDHLSRLTLDLARGDTARAATGRR